ncbi:MAG: PAS domain-containing protein, partial [Candidatus Brocadiia bacterium]
GKGDARVVDNRISDSSRRTVGLILFAAVLAGALFWLFDAMMLVYVFPRDPDITLQEAVFHAGPYSTYHRMLVLAIALGLGLVAEYLARKRRRIQEEHDHLFELSSDPLCVLDDRGHFSQVNPAWKKVLGWTQWQLRGRRWVDLVHPDDQEDAQYTQKDFSLGNEVSEIELRMKDHEGEYRWILMAGSPSGEKTYAVAHDITHRKEAEESIKIARQEMEKKFKERSEELRQAYEKHEDAQQFYTEVLRNVAVGLLVTNSEGRIRLTNREFCNLTGYAPEDLRSREFLDELVAQEDREKVGQHHQRCLETPAEAANMLEFKLTARDGTEKPVVARIGSMVESQMVVYTVLPGK